MSSLFGTIKAQAALTDSVIVSYSGGKDSAVVLDLCVRYFERVKVFFMFSFPDLSFQEAVLRWAEKKYGIEIYRLPHFELTRFYRSGSFCHFDPTLPIIGIQDIYAHVRGTFDIHWIAAGERAADSVVRGAMIKKSGSVDQTRGRFFPIAYWDKAAVMAYIRHHALKCSPESGVLGHSFNHTRPEVLQVIRDRYPADYARMMESLPLIGALTAQADLYGMP